MLHDVIISVPFFIIFQFVHQNLRKKKCSILAPPEGNFDIDAGDGGGLGGGDHLGPQKSQKILRTRMFHTSGTLFQNIPKNHIFFNFIYTEKDTESEYHIQNINL